MTLRRHGVDAATIALWLGHEDVRTTYGVYIHADLSAKENALARTAPPGTPTGGCSITAIGRPLAGRHGSHAGRSARTRNWRVILG